MYFVTSLHGIGSVTMASVMSKTDDDPVHLSGTVSKCKTEKAVASAIKMFGERSKVYKVEEVEYDVSVSIKERG